MSAFPKFDPVAHLQKRRDAAAKVAKAANLSACTPHFSVISKISRVGVAVVDPWDQADWQADFDERAAIMEFDGGLSQAEANRKALLPGIEWPPLPSAGLEGQELDRAWNDWWDRIDQSLSCAN